MRSCSPVRIALLVGALGLLAASPSWGQTRGFDASYGFWWTDEPAAATFTASLHQPLVGPFGYSIGFMHLDDHRANEDRTLSGAELGLSLGRDGSGMFLVGTVGLGMVHGTRALDAAWSAGGGYLWRPFAGLSLGLEARYRVEDRDLAGFWRLRPKDRRGLMVQGRLVIALGGRSPAARPSASHADGDAGAAPSSESIRELARDRGASDDAAALTTHIVETALAVMGTPYEWGGTDENGFDCSGLIQYAYGQHGIILPRVSRDQMRMGTPLDKRLDALRPGDLLGFSVEGTSQITHIGLYVGDGRFIHSASGGVRLTSLTHPDGRWWRQRWVTARRVVE